MRINIILVLILLFIPSYSYSWTSITHWNSSNENGWYTWESAGTTTANITLTPAQPDGYPTTLRITTPAGMTSNAGQQIAGASIAFDSEDEMWAQYYVYYPSDYTWHPIAEKISGWDWPSNTTNNLLLVWGEENLLMAPQLGWTKYIEFTSNTGYNPYQTKNHWYKFKEYVKMNTAGQFNGVYQLWVDDRMVMNYSNVPYRNTGDKSGFTKFVELLVWGGQGGNITLRADMHQYRGTSVVSSQDIIYPQTGSNPTGYKPMSPSNLIIK